MNDLSYKVIGCAYRVHSNLGPGLLESTYKTCLIYELQKSNLLVEWEKPIPLIYNDVKLSCGYRLDLMVEQRIIIEIKSVEALTPIHEAQLLTYLKLTGLQLGLLINFNVLHLKQGIVRRVNGLRE